MGNIVLLDEHTINKIAAGEVVDRPAGVVKELVENSIDAKATNITVEIKNGGISYIKITDNGIGIAADDVEMAVERHATSKIRQEEDLRKVMTMGFRGEALASVAAVSKLTITTKQKDDYTGTKVEVEAGNIKNIEQVAFVTGTTIQVKDLFYNVPARYKFLKKDYTEAGYIEDAITRLALINPHIAFKYINNGKVLINTNGDNDILSTVYSLFGKEIYENVIKAEYEYNGITVSGIVGLPKISRSTRIHQFTYVNSRYVKNKTITSAIDKAYNEELEINKFAFGVVNIKLSPELIDVNVHPAKLEIKFANENDVFEAIYWAVKSAIQNHNKKASPFSNYNMEKNEVSKPNFIEDKYISNNLSVAPSNLKYSEVLKDIEVEKSSELILSEDNNELNDNNIKVDLVEVNNIAVNKIGIANDINNISDITYIEGNNSFFEDSVKEENNQVEDNISSDSNKDYKVSKEDNFLPESYKYIGFAFNTYILIQIGEKLYIIDQHAAHERLIYERVRANYYSKDRQTQMLLIPIILELTPKEKLIVEQNEEMFLKVGYIIEDFGTNTLKISGVPNVGYDIDYKSMFIDTIDELLGAVKTNTQEKEFRFLATVACKAAVKGNMKLTSIEHKALIDDMMKLDRPFTCPHGRPTAYEITKSDIEKWFLRK